MTIRQGAHAVFIHLTTGIPSAAQLVNHKNQSQYRGGGHGSMSVVCVHNKYKDQWNTF